MVEYHNKAFFGSNTGMFFDSGSWTSPNFFLKFIKERSDGTWEKPSQREGKSIKFSLEEMVYMLRVLNKEVPNWNTYHKYEEKKTQITFSWEKDTKESLRINGGDYSKKLNFAQVVVFKSLLNHVFEEKIEHSTVNSKNDNYKKSVDAENDKQKSEVIVTEEIKGKIEVKRQSLTESPTPQLEKVNLDNETVDVKGLCEGDTEKALLILFEGGKQTWIPKSTIRSDFDSKSNKIQDFTIDA